MDTSRPLSSPRRFTFQSKLMAVFAVMALLIFGLLLLGSVIIQHSSQHLSRVLMTQIQPLAQVNHLQSQAHRIRVMEINLPLLNDFFAVTTELDVFREEITDFETDLQHFSAGIGILYPLETRSLTENWRRLRPVLQQVSNAAEKMDMKEVRRLSTYESASRFRFITVTLRQLSGTIEAQSATAYTDARALLDRQHQLFISISLLILAVSCLSLYLFARSLSGRVRQLRDASMRIADGNPDAELQPGSNDELTDLAKAFSVMRDKVSDREQALSQARDMLEQRVEHRTRELQESNMKLSREADERRKVEQNLRILSQAVAQSPVSMIITDRNGRIEYVNGAFSQSCGYSSEEAVGRTIRFLRSTETPQALYEEIWSSILAGREWQGELRNQRKDGSQFWEHTHVSPVRDKQGEISHFLTVKQDITERKAQQQKILYQARYDALTDLPNRMLAMDRLSQAVTQAKRNRDRVLLMFIDLDDFKRINDNLGHEVGDQLLIQAAARLKESVREEDTVARLGGDEFLIITGGLDQREAAESVATSILKAFVPAFLIGGSEQVITPSIGMALYPDDGEETSILLRNADLAMYQAKEDGRNTFHFYNRSVHDNLRHRLELERHLRNALAENELQLQYQPVLDAVSGRIVSVEALLRWRSKRLGLVMPDQFIDIAEHTGLIVDIGNWVIKTACRQVSEWHRLGFDGLHLAVNVSPRQFRGNGLPQTIRHTLNHSGFPAGCLTLEMTEGLLITNAMEARDTLETLNRLGVKLALDDFGTGYSSLSYLKKYPFDTLKIDRSFIRDIVDDPEDRALVAAATSMGRSLGLTVIAEGVENNQQMELLRALHCDQVQGYLFSKPLDPPQLEEMLVNSLPRCSALAQSR